MFRAYSSLAVLAVLFSAAACGGDPPTPKTPETEPVAASTPDMPPPPATVATAETKPTTDAPPPGIPDPNAPPTTLALPTATAKLALKGKKPTNVELKSDGSVTNAGKAVAKVSGLALQGPDGKSLLTVGNDGAVTDGSGASYGSFTGDELTTAKGDKLALGEDGTLTMTSAGKASPLGKFENVGGAKRSAILAAAFVLAPPAAEKPAPAAKPAGKPAGKPAAKK
jgi:hypothetical protein